MNSDPAVLFFIGDWLKSTAEMDADVRGWYLNLLLHNFDKEDLPNDIEKLATLANVKFSEYKRFEQVFEQVFKQKFEQKENGRLTNPKMENILRSRESFKNKRSTAGKVSYVMRYMAKHHTKEYKNNNLRDFVKDNFDYSIDLKNEQVFKHMFKHLFELYRNENENEDRSINLDKSKKKLVFNFKQSLIDLGVNEEIAIDWMKVRKAKNAVNTKTSFTRIKNQIEKSGRDPNECIALAVAKDWKGFEAEWMNNLTKNNNDGISKNEQRLNQLRDL
ncbi:MAG: DUF1376 domain-containing protein [Candidatus Babeliales bacterium]